MLALLRFVAYVYMYIYIIVDFLSYPVQEGSDGIRVAVDVLFSLNQFCTIWPRCDVLYCSSEAVVTCGDCHIAISTTDVIDAIDTPNIILKYNPSSSILERLSAMVCNALTVHT